MKGVFRRDGLLCQYPYKTAAVVTGRARRKRIFSPSTKVDVKVGDVMSVVGVADDVVVITGVKTLSSAERESVVQETEPP